MRGKCGTCFEVIIPIVGFEEDKIFCIDDYYNRIIHGRRKSLGVFDFLERVAGERVAFTYYYNMYYHHHQHHHLYFCASRADVIPKLYSTDNSNNGIEAK